MSSMIPLITSCLASGCHPRPATCAPASHTVQMRVVKFRNEQLQARRMTTRAAANGVRGWPQPRTNKPQGAQGLQNLKLQTPKPPCWDAAHATDGEESSLRPELIDAREARIRLAAAGIACLVGPRARRAGNDVIFSPFAVEAVRSLGSGCISDADLCDNQPQPHRAGPQRATIPADDGTDTNLGKKARRGSV